MSLYLTRHQTPLGPRWALDGRWLPPSLSLGLLLELPRAALVPALHTAVTEEAAAGPLLPPLEPLHEVWACGVTYLRSCDARKAESEVADVYERVYSAARPEIFLKAIGWRLVGQGGPIRVRRDSTWDVPEPELTLVVNCFGEVVGYTAGNDVSSRSIEGENPLYLPQAKIYNGACAVGAGVQLAGVEALGDLPIEVEIWRGGALAFQGATSTRNMNRKLTELVTYLGCELDFPQGVFVMTGTGVVPGDDFTLRAGDRVNIRVGTVALENEVANA
jgi:2-dehydro-3-deoxy-D-arabinonate dehydratase